MPEMNGGYREGAKRKVYFVSGRGGEPQFLGEFPTLLSEDPTPFEPVYVIAGSGLVEVIPRRGGICLLKNPRYADAIRRDS